MKLLNLYNKWCYKIFLPVFGDKKVIYSVQGADWWAWYANDTKKWIFEKGELKL